MTAKTFTTESTRLRNRYDENRPVLITQDGVITFGAFRKGIETTFRNLYRIGIRPGARVAISFPNSKEVLYLAFALIDMGATLIPLHPATPPPFAARMLDFLEASHLIVPSDVSLYRAELPCQVVDVASLADETTTPVTLETPKPDDLAVIITTSGTTADPKFVPISQENFATIIDATRVILEPHSELETGLSYIMIFPLSSSGILPTMAQVSLGSTYVLTDDVSPHNFLSLIETHRLDGMQCPPAYLENLARYPRLDTYDLSSITRLNSGSDFLPNKLLLALKEKFENLTHIGLGYGLAETSAIVATWNAHTENDLFVPTNQFRLVNPKDNEIMILGTNGPAPFGEKGEICIRGKSVISGYYRNPALTKRVFDDEGWLHTGDMGQIEEDGTLVLQSRQKFTIKRGGRSISPKSVEMALEEHPNVERAVVVGVPQPLFGEMIWAFITPVQDASLTVGDINAFCRETLPPYLKPDNVVLTNNVPRTQGVGKIDYSKLRQIGIETLDAMTGDNDGRTD